MNKQSKKMKSSFWLREILIRIGLFSLGIIVSVVLLEVVLRIYSPYSEEFYESNPYYGWSLIPNKSGWSNNEAGKIFIKINSKGLRDREYSYEKQENVYRILVLGDSYCEAAQVPLEDTFHKRLESLLNQRSKTMRYEIISSGVSGYGTDNELLYYKHEGYKFQPDLVLLAFTVGNDISDNFQGLAVESSKPYFVLGETGLKLKNFPIKRDLSLLRQTKDFFRLHSKLYGFLYITFRERIPSVSNLLNKIGLMESKPRKILQNGIIRNFWVFESKHNPEWQKAEEVTKALVLKLKEEVETNNSELVVFLIPKAEQVHENVWVETLEEYPEIKKRNWNFEKPNRFLMKFFDQKRIDALDLLPDLRHIAKTEKKLLYFGRGHWNSEGHLLAAQLLYDYLASYIPIEE